MAGLVHGQQAAAGSVFMLARQLRLRLRERRTMLALHLLEERVLHTLQEVQGDCHRRERDEGRDREVAHQAETAGMHACSRPRQFASSPPSRRI